MSLISVACHSDVMINCICECAGKVKYITIRGNVYNVTCCGLIVDLHHLINQALRMTNTWLRGLHFPYLPTLLQLAAGEILSSFPSTLGDKNVLCVKEMWLVTRSALLCLQVVQFGVIILHCICIMFLVASSYDLAAFYPASSAHATQ